MNSSVIDINPIQGDLSKAIQATQGNQVPIMTVQHKESVCNKISTQCREARDKEDIILIEVPVPFQYDEETDTWKCVPSQMNIPDISHKQSRLNGNQPEKHCDTVWTRTQSPDAVTNVNSVAAKEVKCSDIETFELLGEELVEKQEEKPKKKKNSVFRRIKDKFKRKSKEKSSDMSCIQKLLRRLNSIIKSTGERKGVNKYYPPDWTPDQGGINKYHGTHALRERARKLHMGILIIRFEMPYNIWCEGCKNHIGMGVRYNAEKKKIGMYYSTPVYQFRMKCHLCDNYFEIKTDPANLDYVIISGARRQERRWDPTTNEQ
ncbi:hypothetical protein QYM36_002582, partial [Artemia franciscana]